MGRCACRVADGQMNPAALQPLGVERHADPVVPENLYQRAAASAEHVEVATMRVAPGRRLSAPAPAAEPHIETAGARGCDHDDACERDIC